MLTRRISALLFAVLVLAASSSAQKTGIRSRRDAIPSHPTAVLESSMGTVTIELLRRQAPTAVENFVLLARKGYFNGNKIHRIAKGLLIQTGDPTATGVGGMSAFGKLFKDEIHPSSNLYRSGYRRGMVAMANLGLPNTNGSQYFIVLKDTILPPKFTIFGRVTSGMAVVDSIASVAIYPVASSTDGKPKQDIIIRRVTIQ